MIDELVAKHIPANAYAEQWDVAGLDQALRDVLTLDLPVKDWAKEEGIADEEMRERIERRADEWMAGKVAKWGPDVMRYVEKSVLLQTLDHLWREHLVMLEHLRQVIGLRGYGQRDPLNEYKAEAFSLFEAMMARLREAVTAQLMRVEIVQQPPAEEAAKLPYMEAHKVDPATGEDEMALARRRSRRRWPATAMARKPSAIRTIRRAGARSAATSRAPAAPARNSSTATADLLRRHSAADIAYIKKRRASPAFIFSAVAPVFSGMRGRASGATRGSWPHAWSANHSECSSTQARPRVERAPLPALCWARRRVTSLVQPT